MRIVLVFLTWLITFPAFAEECSEMPYYYHGTWLEKATPTADYILSMPDLEKGSVGCYWIAATPQWGINVDMIHVAKVTNPDLDGGVLIAVGLDEKAIEAGDHAWVWIKNTGLTRSGFQEMWFNRHTKGIER